MLFCSIIRLLLALCNAGLSKQAWSIDSFYGMRLTVFSYDMPGVPTFWKIREFCFHWNVGELSGNFFCCLSGNIRTFIRQSRQYAFANETLMVCVCN